MIQSRGFLGCLFGPSLKIGLPLMKNVTKPLATSVLIPLGLPVAVLEYSRMLEYIKKILGYGTKTLIISNDEMKDIIKIVKSFEDSGLLLKGVRKTIQNEAKEQKRGFLSMLLGSECASLLGNILAGNVIRREGFVRAGYGSSIKNKDF